MSAYVITHFSLSAGGPKMATSCHRLDVEGPILSAHTKSPVPLLSSLDSMLDTDISQLNLVVVGKLL